MKVLKFAFILFAGLLLASSCNSEPTKEDLLIGKWKLTNYSDNIPRDEKQQKEFENGIVGLRIDLEIFDDGTFSRMMQQPGQVGQNNIGEWYLENEDQILTMKVEGAPLSKLLIVEANETKLVLQVEEGGVSTTLSFGH